MLRGLLARLRSWIAVEDEDRTEGSGDVYRDPAYNGRYEAEREVDRLAEAAETAQRDEREG